MKVLTLTQPYATLVAILAKKIETRSWRTNYRGPLAIHAAQGFPRWAIERCFEEPYRSTLAAAGITKPGDLPRGAIVAKTELVGCFATPGEGIQWREYFNGLCLPPDEPERSFGDYGPGRYAWILENIKPIEPIPAKGALSIWEWEPSGD